MKFNFLYPILFSAVAFLSSCQDQYNICEQNKVVEFRAGFYQKNGTADVSTAPTLLSLGTLGSATLLYNQVTGISKVGFSLNPSTDSVKYSIKTANNLPLDTLTLFYSSQSILLSNECGSINVHQLINAKTTINILDSVKIINPTVNTNLTTENLKIYF